MSYYSILIKGLALLRTRFLSAIVMPALIGGAYSVRKDHFYAIDFVAVLVGLSCAELLNLFGSDYRDYLIKKVGGRHVGSQLPGNPVLPPSLLKPERIPFMLIPIGLLGVAALVYFVCSADIIILAFMLMALVIGILYIFNPFPYAFLSTSLIPPIVSGGVYLALSGEIALNAFLAGLPVSWISVAVILCYRVLYGVEASFSRKKAALVIFFYLLSVVNVILYAFLNIFPLFTVIAAFSPLSGAVIVFCIFKIERIDFIPATAAGVFIHSLTSLLIAGFLLV